MDPFNHDQRVKSYYDDWTERYLQSFGDIFQAARAERDEDLVSHFVNMAGIRDGMHLLDAGCGVCGPSIRIAQMVDVSIDAVTISTTQARLARQRISDAGLVDRITVHECNFVEMAAFFGPDRFDRIFFLESLCHSGNPHSVAKECLALLRKEGKVYVKDFYRKPFEGEHEKWSDIVTKRVEQEFRLFVRNIDEICAAMKKAGFETEYCTPLGINYNFAISEQFAKENGIHLYDGGEIINWGDWYECSFRKP